MSSVLKLTIVLMKFSRTITLRIAFQSRAVSPSSMQIDSSAIFTALGGLPIERTSTKCCFLIPFTAICTRGRKREAVSKHTSATPAYVNVCVLKLTMDEMKFSRMSTERIPFQSRIGSPSKTQIDSSARRTAGGGLGNPRSSPSCWRRINLRAKREVLSYTARERES